VPDWSAFADVDPKAPGLVAGVVKDGAVNAFYSAGVDAPGGEPLHPDTIFYVASIAKQFTAACIASLALDGSLALGDSIRRWLPELSPSWQPVQLHHLIAHCGGLRDSNAVDAGIGWGVNSRLTTWDRFEAIAATEPESAPGAVHRYSNHGYVLLAMVVERSSGETLGPFARHALFTEAGMTDSRFLDDPGPDPVPGWAGGSQRVDIQFTCCGDGGLVTSLADLARWDAWLPASRLRPLMLGDRASLPNGRIAHDAWGISIRQHHGLRIESHGGSIDGYLATFVRVPAAAVGIIVLANTDRFGVPDFARRTRALADSTLGDLLDRTQPPWTETHGDPLDR